MIVTGHQPNYLPYLGFFHKITLADIFVIVDTVQYVKRGPFGWINRNKIRTHKGWIWLTVPVISRGKYYQKIIDTKIDSSKDWCHRHWRAMALAYERAPYFSHYQTFFKNLYERPWEKLADLNEEIIRYIINQLGIKVKITKTSVVGTKACATDLIIDICKKLGADAYVHGRHGRDYIDERNFADNNIRCIWQDFQHPIYSQVYQPFIPEMSIIDLLFNHGPKSLDILVRRKIFPD